VKGAAEVTMPPGRPKLADNFSNFTIACSAHVHMRDRFFSFVSNLEQ
jgi:hypothetical protein